jgi:hypothetical protein
VNHAEEVVCQRRFADKASQPFENLWGCHGGGKLETSDREGVHPSTCSSAGPGGAPPNGREMSRLASPRPVSHQGYSRAGQVGSIE